jgi:hypothetical protein
MVGVAGIAVVVAATAPSWAAGAFDSLTEQSITQKVGNLIKLIAGIAGIVVLSVCLLTGGIKSMTGGEDSWEWIKRGLVGGGLCFGCWGLAKLFVSVMQ